MRGDEGVCRPREFVASLAVKVNQHGGVEDHRSHSQGLTPGCAWARSSASRIESSGRDSRCAIRVRRSVRISSPVGAASGQTARRTTAAKDSREDLLNRSARMRCHAWSMHEWRREVKMRS
jgi:hypothetical protein